MSTWARSFGQAKTNIERRMNLVARKVALDAFGRVINRTPVDTGRARGSWGVAIGAPVPGPHDAPGQTALAQARRMTDALQAGQSIFMASNLPYILPLERGWSGQAPQGMVAITENEFRPILDAAIREARRA